MDPPKNYTLFPQNIDICSPKCDLSLFTFPPKQCGYHTDPPTFVYRNAALMAASLWEPAPPVGLLAGAGGRSGREDFAYGWEGREWGASRPEALLRRLRKAPAGRGKVEFGAQQNTILREEARAGWQTHQVTKGSRKEEVSSKSKVGAQSHGRTGAVGKGVTGGAATVLRSAAGLQGYLAPILVNRTGQPNVLGSKVKRWGPRRAKQKRKENVSFVKRFGRPHYRHHHHQKPQRNPRARTRSSKTQIVTQGRSTRLFPPKKPPWETSQSRPGKPPHSSQEVKMGRGKNQVKFEQQKVHPQTAFSLSFDPTVSKERKLQNGGESTANPNASSPPQRRLLTRRQNIRMPPKTSRTRKSSALPQPAIPQTHQSPACETKSHPPRISNLLTPSQRGTQPKKSYRDPIPRSPLGNPHSFVARRPNPRSQRNSARPKSSPPSTLRARKSHSPLPRSPNPRPHQSLSQQTLKKQQWQLPARTAQGWVNIKLIEC